MDEWSYRKHVTTSWYCWWAFVIFSRTLDNASEINDLSDIATTDSLLNCETRLIIYIIIFILLKSRRRKITFKERRNSKNVNPWEANLNSKYASKIWPKQETLAVYQSKFGWISWFTYPTKLKQTILIVFPRYEIFKTIYI